MTSICIVIPCYNEATRFNQTLFEDFYRRSDVFFYFVNDGSKDDTWSLLERIAKDKDRILLINMPSNVGKAEAVRKGMLQAELAKRFDYIGFWDADFATPLDEILQFQQLIRPDIKIITGSRIKRLGARIERSAFRHYFGRIFATIVTKLFQLPIYDTQCGAKLFHQSIVVPLFKDAFHSKWMFDLELFIRFKKLYGEKELQINCYEHPLKCWIDVGGSKMKKMDFLNVPFRILSLFIHYYNK
ncbi:MAG: hypothetical protein JWM14_2990 [Chitinophagaceae bacterium]|nr:hypothetical protein [Chitinophagaceae bacterium]